MGKRELEYNNFECGVLLVSCGNGQVEFGLKELWITVLGGWFVGGGEEWWEGRGCSRYN
jgi:hypothetical protein